MASPSWDGPMITMDIPEARPGSLEALLKRACQSIGSDNFFMTLDDVDEHSPLNDLKGHRAIGVVYWPGQEKISHYVPTKMAQRYDAFIYLNETSALTPLSVAFNPEEIPQTYPFGTRM